MLFNSHEFLFFFLPFTLLVFYLVPKSLRIAVIFVASAVFYGASGLLPLAVMIFATLWGYTSVRLLPEAAAHGAAPARSARRRFAIWMGVSVPVLLLILFKYLNFILTTLEAGPETRDFFFIILAAALPAGISFYTFIIIAYVIDTADGKIQPERNFVRFAAYIWLFPHLIAGPILRYEPIVSQLKILSVADRLTPDWKTAFKYLSFGLFAKVFLADLLGWFHSYTLHKDFVTEGTPTDALFSILSYTFIIYYDFFAYSLIAIALGKMLCIELPRNFREPYLSPTPAEFWRRWHMTLSYWLRDYVYIRLGGNRRYVRNIFIVFIVCGIWHGAGWNFVVWGAYHAVLVTGYHLSKPLWKRMPHGVQVALTFALVTLGWPLFFTDVDKYFLLLQKIVGVYGSGPPVYGWSHWAILAVIAALTFLVRERVWLYNETRSRFFDNPAVHALALFLAILFLSGSRTFIYFRF